MKTKWIPFEPPKIDTVYNPPLKIKVDNKERNLLIYCTRNNLAYICEHSSISSNCNGVLVEVPDEPKRMTKLQLMQLLNRGGWIIRYSSNSWRMSWCTTTFGADELEFDEIVSTEIKVSRIDKIEWIEPTTDLLEG